MTARRNVSRWVLSGPRWSGGGSRALSILADSAKDSHLRGIPRRIVLTTVGAISRLYVSVLNSSKVHNKDTLLSLVTSRPPGTPLITVSNHMSTLDDPLMWGFKGFPFTKAKLCRWTLAASDICFTNPAFSYFFRLGKCIPITRGEGIYQPHMTEALDRINEGEWLHTFPEGKVSQEQGPLRRLKWGVASLIARASVSPIVLPIAHNGFEKVLPEDYWFGRRPPLPLWLKNISIVVGEPMQFDVPGLKKVAHDWSAGLSSSVGNPSLTADRKPLPYGTTLVNPYASLVGSRRSMSLQLAAETLDDLRTSSQDVDPVLDEAARRWMYSHISEHIWVALQHLTQKARVLNKLQSKTQKDP